VHDRLLESLTMRFDLVAYNKLPEMSSTIYKNKQEIQQLVNEHQKNKEEQETKYTQKILYNLENRFE
jgi:hypothetical protein